MTRTLSGRMILMSGGSRGLGLAIALRGAADGTHVVTLAKTGQPHPKLEGTVHTAAAEVEAAGGQAIMAEASLAVLVRDGRTCTSSFFLDDASLLDASFLDDKVLAEQGVTDLDRYRADPTATGPLDADLFLEPLS